MDDDEFRQLVEGVSGVRIAACKGMPPSSFDTFAILGRLDINSILWDMLRSSEDKEANRLLTLAHTLENAYKELEQNTVGERDEGRGAARMGRHRRVPDRGREDRPEGRLLVLARPTPPGVRHLEGV